MVKLVQAAVALSAVSLAHAFLNTPPASVGQQAVARLHAAAACPIPRRRRTAALLLRAAELSLAVSEVPPEKDPLANIPAVKMHTAEGPCTRLLMVALRRGPPTGSLPRTEGPRDVLMQCTMPFPTAPRSTACCC